MRLARVLVVVLAAVLVQLVLARYAVGGRFAFDFVLVGVVFVALQSGAVGGMVAGTVGGLLQDVFSGGIVGVLGLVKTLVGYAAGAFGTRFVVAKAHARALIVGAATLVHGLMASGLHAIIDQAWPTLRWTTLLQEVFVNVIVGWVAFQVTESLPGAVARGRARQRSQWSRRRW
jgi:rod shape-determining protein MreD